MMLFVPWNARAPAVASTAELLAALARGDGQALDVLYRREAGGVYRYLLALAGDEAAAADATQEAFIALAARPGGYDPARGASLGAYLAGIGRHALYAQWRARGLAPDDSGAEADAADGGPTDAPSPEALLVRRQDVAQVHAALARLPWAFREAVVLVDLQGRAYAEAAAIAGCELNTLRTRLHRGRARLAELLGAAPAGDGPPRRAGETR